jgi:hypothetical protein
MTSGAEEAEPKESSAVEDETNTWIEFPER